jgi:hypothetical protein
MAENVEEHMANYSVMIAMSQQTVNTLALNNFVLYGFKAVRSSLPGAPLVWFQSTSYGTETDLSWSQEFQAYTSTSQIVPGGAIRASNSYAADLQQTLEVTGPKGTGQVVHSGTPSAISIHNLTETEFRCGISEIQPDGGVTPMCVFPLFGGNLDIIAPIAKILLMFSSTPVRTGTVVFQSYGRGLLIDLTGAQSREVAYDVNAGWSWGGGAWAQQVPASAELVPLLIDNHVALSQEPRTLQAPAAVPIGAKVPAPAPPPAPATSSAQEQLVTVSNGHAG